MSSFLPAGEEGDSDGFEDYQDILWDENGFMGSGISSNYKEKHAQSSLRSSDKQYSWTSPRSKNHSHKQHQQDCTNHNGNGMVNLQTHVKSDAVQNKPQVSMGQKIAWNPCEKDIWSSNSSFLTFEDLQRASVKGNVGVLEKCLKQGLPVDEPMRHGWTALMFSVNYANVEAVQFLLQSGANPSHGNDMYSPLMAACNACKGSDQDIARCVQLLLDSGADVNAKDRHHTTCLMLACREGHLETVQLLIQKGASVNLQDYKGWTALTWAVQRQRQAVVAELMDAGADCTIQHVDKLTVKDLAAHLPTDEMLALLERRPPNVVNCSGETVVDTSKRLLDESSNCIIDLGEAQAKLTDLRYGELEVFLIGLDLPHLITLCRKQAIDLDLLLNLTEADLINAGISQVGARKKILDAAQTVHKKDWEASSLVSIHYNKKIICADAVAVVANSSKHLRYISSSMMYVKGQLRRHPEAILQATDRVSPSQLLRHTEDAMRNLASLNEELKTVHKELITEMTTRSCDPSDIIRDKRSKWRHIVKTTLALSLVTSISGLIIIKKDAVKNGLETVMFFINSTIR